MISSSKHLFYSNKISQRQIELSEEESLHCVRVMRMKEGDNVGVTDGVGSYYDGKVIVPNHKKTLISIEKITNIRNPRNYYLHIAIAPTKNIDRFEYFLEKATEIGIDEITPILCENSERKIIKPERLRKILISAMKQSGQAYLPKLNALSKFADFVAENDSKEKFIAHCYDVERRKISDFTSASSDFVFAIGPEGDFSVEEIELSKNADFKAISLGSTRLRTETAGVFVAAKLTNC